MKILENEYKIDEDYEYEFEYEYTFKDNLIYNKGYILDIDNGNLLYLN